MHLLDDMDGITQKKKEVLCYFSSDRTDLTDSLLNYGSISLTESFLNSNNESSTLYDDRVPSLIM
jgi:hypothetical protein